MGTSCSSIETGAILRLPGTRKRPVNYFALVPLAPQFFPKDSPQFNDLFRVLENDNFVKQYYKPAQSTNPERFYDRCIEVTSRLPKGCKLPLGMAVLMWNDNHWGSVGYIGFRGFMSDGSVSEDVTVGLFLDQPARGHNCEALVRAASWLAVHTHADVPGVFNFTTHIGNGGVLHMTKLLFAFDPSFASEVKLEVCEGDGDRHELVVFNKEKILKVMGDMAETVQEVPVVETAECAASWGDGPTAESVNAYLQGAAPADIRLITTRRLDQPTAEQLPDHPLFIKKPSQIVHNPYDIKTGTTEVQRATVSVAMPRGHSDDSSTCSSEKFREQE